MSGGPPYARIGLPHSTLSRGRPPDMYSTTGLTRERIVDLCVMIHNETAASERRWPPILGLFKSVTVALTYMRRNRVQAELAETYGVSQPTISRAVTGITPLVAEVLGEYAPTADDLDGRAQYIVDGTLLPCWSWASHPELYSGKHKTTGMNVQVACTLTGHLAWISDPVPGSRHDSYCLSESEALMGAGSHTWLGDREYIENNMITPFRKPAGGELLKWQKEFSTQVSKSLLENSGRAAAGALAGGL